MMAAMVVPLGWPNNARIDACLEPADAWDEADLGPFTFDAGPGLEREAAALFVALTDRVVGTADLDFLLERFSVDVTRNNKGVPRGAQIRFGLL